MRSSSQTETPKRRQRQFTSAWLTALGLACLLPGASGQAQRTAPDSPRPERAIYTEPGDIPRIKVNGEPGKEQLLPLKHTQVEAHVYGYVASVTVTQQYRNDSAAPLEAIYVFPLPENSAVDGMKIRIADRTIEAQIKRRAEAKEDYNRAKQNGQTAALLEQERPNVFTQSITHIPPQSRIDVTLHYVQTLTYDAGEYEFVFPMVVGPRFFPGDPALSAATGSGWAADTSRVPDASRVSPPIIGKGQRTGHDIALSVSIHAPVQMQKWEIPTHDVVASTEADGSAKFALADHENIANRDFVMRYAVAKKEPFTTVLRGAQGNDDYVTIIVQPPELNVDAVVGRREFIFVVDISGSMHGVPLSMCKDAMRAALQQVRPVDTFNIYSFAGYTGKAFAQPRPASDATIKEGLSYIDSLRAGGGTQMADAVAAALGDDGDNTRTRHVFFMTDGYVGNENEILRSTSHFVETRQKRGQKARVFGFGVGSSVNRMLIDGLGKQGNGLSVYASTREDPAIAVNKFFRYVDHSVLSDIKLEGDGISEITPAVLPDLFASHPLTVHAKLKPGSFKAGAALRITGTHADRSGAAQTVALSVPLPERSASSPTALLWARSRVSDFERDIWFGDSSRAIAQITELGLAHKMVTAYTSLIAVDSERRDPRGLHTVTQPVEEPEGVNSMWAGGTGRAANSIGGLGAQGTGSGGGGYGSAPSKSVGVFGKVAERHTRAVSEEVRQEPIAAAPSASISEKEDRTPADRPAATNKPADKKTSEQKDDRDASRPAPIEKLKGNADVTRLFFALTESQRLQAGAARSSAGAWNLQVTVLADAQGKLLKVIVPAALQSADYAALRAAIEQQVRAAALSFAPGRSRLDMSILAPV